MMAERRREMERKKFGAVLGALAAGLMLSTAGPVQAQVDGVTGYLQGDPAPGKLVPYWAIGGELATIVGIENTSGQEGPEGGAGLEMGLAGDVSVHVTVFSTRSLHIFNADLCLSPFDFGFVVLQEDAPSDDQLDSLRDDAQIIIFGGAGGLGGNTQGYLSLKATKHATTNGTCKSDKFNDEDYTSSFTIGAAEPIAAWTILQDIGDGFFATEVPVATALVSSSTGAVTGGTGAFGLIPGPFDSNNDGKLTDESDLGNRVIARFDVNPTVGSDTTIFVWLRRNAFVQANDAGSGINRGGAALTAFLDCEEEEEFSTTIFLPDEVNLIQPETLSGISQCTNNELFRGVLRFRLPDTGFLWSHISQDGQHFRENFLGYNLDCNWFIGSLFGASIDECIDDLDALDRVDP
jgi:hypothetical protein